MIKEYNISSTNINESLESLKNDWKDKNNKLFKFSSDKSGVDEVRDFYYSFFSKIGQFLNLAEDAREKDRSKGRTGETWCEVRNDSTIKNAYRHATIAQPLHTDGSYIPNYSTSIMACVSNVEVGGETIFVDLEKILNDLKNFNLQLYNFATSEEVKHERSGDERKNKIFYYEKNILKSNFNYYCVSNTNSSEVIEFSKKLFEYFVSVGNKERKKIYRC